MREIYNFKAKKMFLILLAFYLLLGYFTNTLILTREFYYSIFGTQFTSKHIEQMINNSGKYQWLSYMVIPILLYVKIHIVCCLIFLGIEFSEKKLSYSYILKIVLFAELAMLLSAITKFSYFIIIGIKDMPHLKSFYPFSIIDFFDPGKIPSYFIYPLQLLNIFELAYWLILAFGIMVFTNQNFGKSLRTVASSYGLALIIWVVFIVFIQIQFT
jgi:hypothetical protein